MIISPFRRNFSRHGLELPLEIAPVFNANLPPNSGQGQLRLFQKQLFGFFYPEPGSEGTEILSHDFDEILMQHRRSCADALCAFRGSRVRKKKRLGVYPSLDGGIKALQCFYGNVCITSQVRKRR